MTSPDNHFVLLVIDHRVLGYLVLPYLIEKHNKAFYTPRYLINEETLPSIDAQQNEWIAEAAEIASALSESHLSKRFSKKQNPVDFLREMDEKAFNSVIRPYIDKQVNNLLKIALQYNIPVYSGSQHTSIFPEMELILEKEPLMPWFHFRRGAEGTTYILELYHNDKRINIKEENNYILSYAPCWLKAGTSLYQLPDGFDGRKLGPFLKKDSISIPRSSESNYFRKFILKNIKKGHVRAEGFDIVDIHPEPGLILSIEQDWHGEAVLITCVRYGNKKVLAGDRSDMFTDLVEQDETISFNRVHRKKEWESRMLERIAEMGLKAKNENTFTLEGNSQNVKTQMPDLVAWLNRNSEALGALPAIIEKPAGIPDYFTGQVHTTWKEEAGMDWFDIHGVVRMGEYEFPFIRFRKHILEGRRTFTLPDGQVAVLPEEWFSGYRDILLLGEEKNGALRVRKWHKSLIPNTPSYSTPELDFAPPEPVHVPEDLTATLRTYQKEGLQWMQFLNHNHYGGCLADDMGLGKTIQTLAMLLSQKNGTGKASLVIMPSTLIHNWVAEIEKFTPSLSFYIHTGSQRAETSEIFSLFDVVLTTYGILRNDIKMLSEYPFHYIILDESQAIKNPGAKVSKSVFRLISDHRLALTGTPIENTLYDLWSQMNFLNPGLLGSERVFEQEFLSRMGQDEAVAEKLKKLISPFILRRRKQEVEPELPPLTEEILYCEMSSEHRKFYEEERSVIRRQVLENLEQGKSSHKSIAVFRALTRLRQAANHPYMIDKGYEGTSGKFDEIRNVIETLIQEGNKVLVFSSFVKHLNILAGWLQEEKLSYSMLTGQTRDRQQVIEQFRKEEERSIFLISLKAGGTGLNLTEAGYVLMLDPWWNPASEQQAIHRAHRIGQDKPVIAYKFITQDSIEEKILKLQEKKKKLYVDFIPSENPLEDMSREEVEELFE